MKCMGVAAVSIRGHGGVCVSSEGAKAKNCQNGLDSNLGVQDGSSSSIASPVFPFFVCSSDPRIRGYLVDQGDGKSQLQTVDSLAGVEQKS